MHDFIVFTFFVIAQIVERGGRRGGGGDFGV